MSEPFSKMLRGGGSPAHGFWEVAEAALDDMTVEEAHVSLAGHGLAERGERGVLTEPTTGLTDVRWAEPIRTPVCELPACGCDGERHP